MTDRTRHPVFFERGRVDAGMRVQAVLLLLALGCLLGGAAWWAAGGPGWALMLGGPGLTLLTFLFSCAWRRRHERRWWGGRRGWPPYLDERKPEG